jgi:hypothetical protein
MADGSFRIAGAFVEVNLKDNTAADEAKLRARLEKSTPVDFETALKDPGNVQAVKARISSGPAATIRTDADTALAQAKIKELSSRRNAAIVSLDADVSKAEARIKDLESKRGKTKLDVDAEIGKAQAKIEALKAKKNRILLEVDIDKPALAKAVQEIETATEKVAQRTQAQFKAMQFVGAFAGLPAAAAAGVLGVSAVLGAVPLLFGGVTASIARNNATVAQSFSSLTDRVTTDVTAMATPMQGTLLQVSDRLGASFTRLEPQIANAMNNSRGAVLALTDGVTGLAENAMPGLNTAIANSGPVMYGLTGLLKQTGSGINDLFTNLSKGSVAAGQSMSSIGGLVRDLLGFTGSLLANLSQGAAGVLPQFRAALSQVEGVLLSLTSSGMPALTGATRGFLTVISGGLSIIQAGASALGSWAAPLGSMSGAMFATNSIARMFGTSLAETGGGVGAFAKTVDDGGKKISPFSAALKEAGTAGTSKLQAGIGALASSGFNPLGIALVAGGLLLDIWGKNAQAAAAKAQAHQQAVDSLTEAYRKDNGVIGANVAAVATKALTDKNAYTNSKVFGLSMTETTAAGLGQAGALDVVVGRAKAYVTTLLSGTDGNKQMLPTVLQNIDAFAKQGGNAADLVNNLSAVRMHSLNLSDSQHTLLVNVLDGVAAMGEEGRASLDAANKARAFQEAVDKLDSSIARGLTPAAYGAQVATSTLGVAFEALNKSGGDAASKGQALIDVMDQLSGRSKAPEEALQTFNDHLRDIATNFDQAKKKGDDYSKGLVDATGAINTTTKAGSDLQNAVRQGAADMAAYGQSLKDAGAPADVIESRLGGMRTQLEKQLAALGMAPDAIKKVLDNYGAIPANITTTLGLEGDKESQAKITKIQTDLRALDNQRTGLHVNALTAPAEAELLRLHDIVVRLPDGTFQVFANTAEGKAAADALLARVGNSRATIAIDGNPDPATGKLNLIVQKTDGSVGRMTVDARTDPATQKLMVAVQAANGARGWMTVDAFNDAAKQRIGDAVVVANNARGFIQVGANTSSAEGEINYTARDRSVTLRVRTVNDGGYYNDSKNQRKSVGNTGLADGGVLRPYAAGGIAAFASGGMPSLTPMQPLASMVPKDTWRVVGDNMKVPEAYIPIDPASRRSQDLLSETNALMGRPAGESGDRPHITVNVNAQTGASPAAMASAMSGELSWLMRAR